MTDMGVPAYMVASSVIAVLAQRLVRKICTRCKHPVTLTDAQLEDAGIPPEVAKNAKFAKGKGCPYCQKKGYRGRIGIYELMVVNGKIREMMFKGVSDAVLRTQAINQGMTTLYCDGIRKVVNGTTTLDEVYRTAKRTEQESLAMKTLIAEYASGAS
jgi:type IV pilus assembly protein PilB